MRNFIVFEADRLLLCIIAAAICKLNYNITSGSRSAFGR